MPNIGIKFGLPCLGLGGEEGAAKPGSEPGELASGDFRSLQGHGCRAGNESNYTKIFLG